MGYCFTEGGGLVCDCCGTSSGTKKRPCPFGWCQAPALCETCSATNTADRHSGCKEYAARALDTRERENRLLEAGAWLRCSASNANNGLGEVRVTFRNAAGKTRELFMARETYRAIPLMTPTTPDDYAAIGAVREQDAPPATAGSPDAMLTENRGG